jgi:hypothetical protein
MLPEYKVKAIHAPKFGEILGQIARKIYDQLASFQSKTKGGSMPLTLLQTLYQMFPAT